MKRLRKYRYLKKLNKYLLEDKSKSMPLFNSLIKSRAEGLNLDISKSFFAPRNPLHSIYAFKTLYMRYRAVFDYLDIQKPKSILEIGCGTGLGSWILSDLTDNIIAIDNNLNDIAIARKLFPEVKFVVADAYKHIEQLEPGKIDVLISSFGPIIDYGLAKKFTDLDNTKLFKRECSKTRCGTVRYMSIGCHKRTRLSRKDDLLSLGYVLIYLYVGNLPWQGLDISDRKEKVFFTVIK